MTIADTHYAVELEGGREQFTIERNYKIIRKVGSGSYGTVCSAIELDTNEGKRKKSRIFSNLNSSHPPFFYIYNYVLKKHII